MNWTPAELDTFSATLAQGDVAIAPAEGVYGYCADPAQPAAIDKLNALKQRPASKAGYIVLFPNIDMLAEVCDLSTPTMQDAVARYCPCPATAPVTLICPLLPPACRTFAALLPPNGTTLAARIPACPYMQKYLTHWGKPLVSTSVNISGQPPIHAASCLPKNMTALKFSKDLSGVPSKLFDPRQNVWLR